MDEIYNEISCDCVDDRGLPCRSYVYTQIDMIEQNEKVVMLGVNDSGEDCYVLLNEESTKQLIGNLLKLIEINGWTPYLQEGMV